MHMQSTKKVLDFFGIEPMIKNTDNDSYTRKI